MTNELVYRLVLAKRDGQPPLIPARYRRRDPDRWRICATGPFVGDWRPLWRTALSRRLKVIDFRARTASTSSPRCVHREKVVPMPICEPSLLIYQAMEEAIFGTHFRKDHVLERHHQITVRRPSRRIQVVAFRYKPQVCS
jgi:hypothetical protein